MFLSKNYQFRAVVDPSNEIGESDNSNNTMTIEGSFRNFELDQRWF